MNAADSAALAVSCWAAYAPGLPDRASWHEWAAGKKSIAGPADPDVSFVKPLLRRRLSPLNRMAFYVASSRSEEHTSELQSLMRISYAVFCLKKKKTQPRERATYQQPQCTSSIQRQDITYSTS